MNRMSKKNGSPIKRRKVASKPTIEPEDESDPIVVSELRIPRPKESDGASTARALWALVNEVKGLLAMRKADVDSTIIQYELVVQSPSTMSRSVGNSVVRHTYLIP